MNVRVRFAPSPTGFMHIGNVRAALLNYLFAQQTGGTFILRIEDTDTNRNVDAAHDRILHDLKLLKLHFTEGPEVGGAYGPYCQSERSTLYQQYLATLIADCKVYRCFCTAEELEAKREKQRAMGKPPRYDRTCAQLSDEKIKAKLAISLPFVWRFKLNYDALVTIQDMAKGNINFELKNFSDFALTRADGSATFMFANFVDDVEMKISHVIRGEDHLSNTALQAALYDACNANMPKFWHLPIICNKTGEKLSKRDFGFSLEDLLKAGYLPEAIVNYMATVGMSFKEEVQSLAELAKNYPFNHLHSTAAIRYDVEKLTWFNHKWFDRMDLVSLKRYLIPLIHQYFPTSTTLSETHIDALITAIKSDLKTLHDVKDIAAFFFQRPVFDNAKLEIALGAEKAPIAKSIIHTLLPSLTSAETFVHALKAEAQSKGLSIKEIFGTTRFMLTGSMQGIGVQQLIELLGLEEAKKRLTNT